jgi:predicted nucleotidyltransferase
VIPAIEEHRVELVELCRRHHGLRSLFERSIDLVDSSMLRNPYRRQEIEATQVLLHAAA